MLSVFFNILVFPGLLFLFVFGLAAEYIDRKLYARFQNRVGPPWFQPFADFMKLIGKEEITPLEADNAVFRLMPVLAIATSATAILYIPMWSQKAIFSFNGDIIVVLYLLTVPTLTYFLGGWYSRSVYSMIGAMRSLTQLFAYEVPFFLCVLAPALLADTWSISAVVDFYNRHPGYWLWNIPGFIIAVVLLLGKLEKVPFDIPDAETEIVAGPFTEYGGKLFAFVRAAINIETVVCASLLAALFLPSGNNFPAAFLFISYLLRVLLIIAGMSFLRSLCARLRLDQMISLCWRVLAPLALAQVLINLILKGVLPR